jgi:pimeloyl-ACP methyl ester carboxylesterase
MSEVRTHHVTVNGYSMRVLEKGSGPKLAYLGGLAGVPRWTPFLDSLAERFHVVCPSLPGFPGATGHEDLDSLTDWMAATLDLFDAADITGADVCASSVGAMLALELAALSPGSVNRMALMAPLGLYDDATPVPHIWARKGSDLPALLCVDTEALARLQAAPEGGDPVEWNIVIARATAAGARLLWPTCDLGLAKRLHRVSQPTLFLWGTADAIVWPSYMELFRKSVKGPTQGALIQGAGHLIDIDAPAEAARAVTRFLM